VNIKKVIKDNNTLVIIIRSVDEFTKEYRECKYIKESKGIIISIINER